MPLLSSITSKIYRPVFRDAYVPPAGVLDEDESFHSNNVLFDSYYDFSGMGVGAVQGMTFSSNGTKIFVLKGDSYIYEFDMSTAWDLTTASYNNVSVDMSTYIGTTTGASDLWLDSSGTRLYALQDASDRIIQFSLSTANDLSTASHVQTLVFATLSDYGSETTHTGMSFKSDGTKVFFLGATNDKIYSYSLSTAWDISTLSYDSVSLSIGSLFTDSSTIYEGSGEAIWTDGTKMVIAGTSLDGPIEFKLSTPWNLSTASLVGFNRFYGTTILGGGSGIYSVQATSNYIFFGTHSKIVRFKLGDGTLTGPTLILKRGPNGSAGTQCQGSYQKAARFNSNGSKIFVLESSAIYEYDLSTNYSITTMNYNNVSYSPDIASKTLEQCFLFGDSGNKYYETGYNNSTIVEYDLSSAYDLSTRSYVQERRLNSSNADGGSGFNIGTNGSYAWMECKSDGTMFFVSFTTGIYKINFNTAWDISTASYDGTDSGNYLLFSDLGLSFNEPVSFGFNSDGSKIYMFNRTTRLFYQISLGSQYNFSSSYLDSSNYDVSYLDSSIPTCTLFDISTAGAFYFFNSSSRRHVFQFDV